MCGRYYVDDETAQAIEKLVRDLGGKIGDIPRGDIHPIQQAPVIMARSQEISVELCPWGFHNFQNKGVIFNARSETALEKRMFKQSVLKRRCIIPAAAFYEWNKAKEKFTFRRTDGALLYLAGFYNQYDGENHFVILTTEPNESVEGVHDRMPLVLEKAQIEDWLFDDETTEFILHQIPVQLQRSAEYEQQTLDFRDV